MPYFDPRNPLAQQGPPVMDSRMMGPPTPEQMALMEGQGPPREMFQPGMGRPSSAMQQQADRMRQLYPDPRGKRTSQHVGSALLPALFAGLIGANPKDAMMYGLGSAAFNYNNELNSYKQTETAISEAAAGMPQAEATFDLTQARTLESLSSAQYTGAGRPNGRMYGSANFQAWVMMGKPGLEDPDNATPEEESEAFVGWAEDYSKRTLAPHVLTGPQESQLVGAGGDTRASIEGPLAPTNVDASVAKAGREAGEAESWKLNESQYNTLADLNFDMRASADSIDNLIKKVESGPETGPTSTWRALIDPDLQELKALMSEAVLAKAATARASGVTFGAMTIAEWQMLAETVSKLGNTKKGNLKILKNIRAKLQRQLYYNQLKLNRIPEGASSRPPMPTDGSQGGPQLDGRRPSGSRLTPMEDE